MSKSAMRWSALAPILAIFISLNVMAQSAPRPLRASEVMALEAGGALQGNIAHDIASRGLNFQPSEEFVSLLKKAGADAGVLEALKAAKVTTSGDAPPDHQLLVQISDAAVLMKQQKYGDATAKLSEALDSSFARMETGYVMAELLRQQERFDVALSVYGEILEKQPDFPEVHVKASYLLYRGGDADSALNEANAALAENPNDAEAHKNKGLALELAHKPDAAIGEYNEALRIRPDYAAVRYDLGNIYFHAQRYDEAIVEYKKTIAVDPNYADAYANMGLAYKRKGDVAAAIPALREAKRLKPDAPAIRQNLASTLMQESPGEAIKELKELEQKFPDFELCHVCLGRALAWQGDAKGAEEEFRKASAADPGSPDGHRGLGSMQEQHKNYDAALEEYRAAEKIDPDDAETHKDIGKVLMAKEDYVGALQELKKAESLAQSSWEIHELYGEALEGNGQIDLAIGEFKEAIALNPTKAYAMMKLGTALEKKGDWPAALDQYRKAVLSDSGILQKAQAGAQTEVCGKECRDQYTSAQARFADYLVSLKSSGHASEAADLEKQVAQLDSKVGTEEKVQMLLKAGDQAFQLRKIEDAEKSYKEAVDLAKNLPPGNENMIVALGRLGGVYGMRQNFTDASATLHQELALVEKTFGPGTTRSVEPLQQLAMVAAWQKNYTEAESYLQKALDINSKMAGDNDPRAVDTLRSLAGLYMTENDYPKAETYLLRAVKGAEASDQMVLIPLWGLCDMYDRWGKAEKSQPCWHHATEVMEKQYGQQSPQLAQSLTNEANALRKMGRTEEAAKVEERVSKIRRTAN